MMKFNHIAVMYHPRVESAATRAAEICEFLRQHDISSVCASLDDPGLPTQIEAKKHDLLIALGGDGTMLRAGHFCAPYNVPILGINLGKFGFLTEIRMDEWRDILPRLLGGDFWMENRMMLLCEHIRAGQLFGSWEVLNEVWVGRGENVRAVHLHTRVDNRYLTSYVADGLIAATPTGSTAYALAAGGPILPPELRNILLVAVAPHLSLDRAIVLAEGSSVNITIETDHQAVLSVDGQSPIHLENGDQVNVRASSHTCNFVRFQDPAYFYRNLTPHMSNNPITGNKE